MQGTILHLRAEFLPVRMHFVRWFKARWYLAAQEDFHCLRPDKREMMLFKRAKQARKAESTFIPRPPKSTAHGTLPRKFESKTVVEETLIKEDPDVLNSKEKPMVVTNHRHGLSHTNQDRSRPSSECPAPRSQKTIRVIQAPGGHRDRNAILMTKPSQAIIKTWYARNGETLRWCYTNITNMVHSTLIHICGESITHLPTV